MKIGLLIIATGKYKSFVQPLLESAKKHFMKGHQVIAYVFCDEILKEFTPVVCVQTIIEPYRFPFASLYRYEIFDKYRDMLLQNDYLFYCDADMRFVADIGDEILPDITGLTAIQHPGFYKGGWGSQNTHVKSTAYIPASRRRRYYCGGFQGGTAVEYLKMASVLKNNIQKDLLTATNINFTDNSGVLADYHDETHYNWYMSYRRPKVLTPSYCYPESWDLPFEKKLLALNKNHTEIRS